MDNDKTYNAETVEETSGEEKQVLPIPAEESGGVRDYLLTMVDPYEETGVMREDNEAAKWAYLASESRRRHILTGIVSSMERMENRSWASVIDFYGIRVLIPLREMVLAEWPEGTEPVWSVWNRIRQMLGATVEFIPMAVDIRNHAVVGSRKEAMLIRQKQFYATGRIYAGMRVECRVIGVSDNGVTLEAAGVDSSVRSRHISHNWFSSAADLYSVGDIVEARVLETGHDALKDRYSVKLSIKDAQEKDDGAALKKLARGSICFGTVTGVRDGNIYIRLQAGCNAATRLYRCRDMPARDDTVSFEVRRIDEEQQMVFGVITRIIRRHPAMR